MTRYAVNWRALIADGDAGDHVGLAELAECKAEMDARVIEWGRFTNNARTLPGFGLAPGD